MTKKSENVHVGDIAIRSAQLLLADPMQANEVVEKFEQQQRGRDLNQDLVDGKDVVSIRKDFSPELNMGIGLVLPIGLGDGIYPVIAHYETTKHFGRTIRNISIRFENPLRGSGCAKREPHKVSEQCFFGSLTKKDYAKPKKKK